VEQALQGGGGRIAIVGAGFSGAALAVQLLLRGASQVTLVERSGVFGPGLAYGTRCERHLLNVRSGRMSLFPDAPDHFIRWLAGAGLDAAPDGFARRADYGRYIQACLADAQARAPDRLAMIGGEATDLRTEGDTAVLLLADGRSITAEHVILAGGNPPPAPLAVGGAEAPDRMIRDPWAAGALEVIGPDHDVFLVGTGLTAVDVLLALEAGGWKGRATAVSRRGLLPRTHATRADDAGEGPPDGPLSLRLRELRRRGETRPWTAVMDGLRPYGQALWRDASPAERRRFLRHLRPWWDVHRHRMAPEIGSAVARLTQDGRLYAAGGRLQGADRDPHGLTVVWTPRGGGEPRRTRVGWLINCTGPQGDPSRAEEPLLNALLARGAARTDPLRLGLDVDDRGRLRDAEGRSQPRLWAMGPLTRGALWEIVAVPEIRQQAADLAARLAPAASTAKAAPAGRYTAHLDEVGETYFQHMKVAVTVGGQLFAAGAACMVHAVAPWMFTRTASRMLTRLHAEMMARRASGE
jgi:uncharacterized NAD(P)/FAD-binding protein YdhS